MAEFTGARRDTKKHGSTTEQAEAPQNTQEHGSTHRSTAEHIGARHNRRQKTQEHGITQEHGRTRRITKSTAKHTE
eukprot:9493849-Pyramimonas_sp.AAC.1